VTCVHLTAVANRESDDSSKGRKIVSSGVERDDVPWLSELRFVKDVY